MNKRQRDSPKTSNKVEEDLAKKQFLCQNLMGQEVKFGPNYPKQLIDDYYKIMCSTPTTSMVPQYINSLPGPSRLQQQQHNSIEERPNPNRYLLTPKSSRNYIAPPSFYREDENVYVKENEEMPVNQDEYIDEEKTDTESTLSSESQSRNDDFQSEDSEIPSEIGNDDSKVEIKQEIIRYDTPQSCISDQSESDEERNLAAALILASMRHMPINHFQIPQIQNVKTKFEKNLPPLHHGRHKIKPEDNQWIDLIAEFKNAPDSEMRSEAKAKILQFQKEKRIARRVEELKELMSNPAMQNWDPYTLTALISKKYKAPEINMEKAMREWNKKYEKEISKQPMPSFNLGKINNEIDCMGLPTMTPVASTSSAVMPAFHSEPNNGYKHKKVNYKNFVAPDSPPESECGDSLEIDNDNPLSEEMQKRLMQMKMLYYKMGIDNLNDNSVHFSLDYKYNENKSRIRTDYQNKAKAAQRTKNNIASRRSRHRKKFQIFSMTNIVDFDNIMINILQNSINSATKSALELEARIGDPELIKKFRKMCSIKTD